MIYRIIICLLLLALTACTPARMAVDPALNVDSVKHKITEMPGVFSGDTIAFGPYKATKIDRSWVKSTGGGGQIGNLKFGSSEQVQSYSYQFNSKSSWDCDCEVSKQKSQFAIVSTDLSADLNCYFSEMESGSDSASKWRFSFSGESPERATGSIVVGSKTFTVKPVNKVASSSFAMGNRTGYYFYSGEELVAGVDAISKEGPVWLSNKLSQEEKDYISMVAVGLLLNQIH